MHPDLLPIQRTVDLYVQPILYCGGVTFPKLSILILYLRIFTEKISRIICWALFVIISTLSVVNIFLIVFQCNPRSKAWNPTEPGHCHNIVLHFVWASFPNIATDVIMLILPLPVIYNLHTRLRVKLGLMATFMIGSM